LSQQPGENASKDAGENASKYAGQDAGENASQNAGENASKYAGEKATKNAGQDAGEKASKNAGQGAAVNAGPVAPRASEKPLCQAYDVALLDLDGVVYIGGEAIPGASQALRKAGDEGMRLAYVTNNANRTPAAVAEILNGFGISATREDVVTSAQAAARLLAERLPAGSAVLAIGGMGLRVALRERGLRPVSTAAERPAAVAQGYAPGISYPLLAEGGRAVAAGALFVGTNADRTLPSQHGLQPGNGSLLQVIAYATGRTPLIAGKPEPPLHKESVIRTGARHPLVVGDRLDTDIEAAWRVDADSLLVLTGVTGTAEAVLAPPHQRPTYVAGDLSGLLEPQPAVSSEGGTFGCGGWTVRWTDDGQLELCGRGARIDGLRALCAAAWSRDGVTAGQIRQALQILGEPRLPARSTRNPRSATQCAPAANGTGPGPPPRTARSGGDAGTGRGGAPFGDLEGPAEAITAGKADFGADRIQRWFGRPGPV
jgi:glycerol-1-phosphatase